MFDNLCHDIYFILLNSRMEKISTQVRETLLTLSIIVLFGQAAFTQHSLNAAGGVVSGSGGSCWFSLGQMVYTTHAASTGSISPGVQHPYEIFVTDVSELVEDLQCDILPNPANTDLWISIGESSGQYFHYQIIDAKGTTCNEGMISHGKTQISLADLQPAVYFLRLVDPLSNLHKTFKIIKLRVR